MDTTYWGRNFGLMLFKDAYSKENLLWYYVKSETNALYIKRINELKSKGFEVVVIICDGRKGLPRAFDKISLFNCVHFIKWQLCKRDIYLKTSKSLASIDLKRSCCYAENDTDKESFEGGLEFWFTKWESLLK